MFNQICAFAAEPQSRCEALHYMKNPGYWVNFDLCGVSGKKRWLRSMGDQISRKHKAA
ncbi:MAG: hypothetical protein Q7K57_24425 [Burkholderiaceae bacterium]|nr:hypothetical protein [Burkholderiaceae bacterium]